MNLFSYDTDNDITLYNLVLTFTLICKCVVAGM